MYDVCFSYIDGKAFTCSDISKITVSTSNGYEDISGDEIMDYHFRIHDDMYLYSADSAYTVSSKDLRTIEIRKK